MSRAVALNNAINTLRLPYTYTITATGEKAKAREEVGKLAAGMLENIRDEMIHTAVLRWTQGQ